MTRTRVAALVAAVTMVAAGVAAAPTASAKSFNPGEFNVQMDMSQGGPGQGGPGQGGPDEGMAPEMNCVDEDGNDVDFFQGTALMTLLADVPEGGITLECGTSMVMEFAAMEQSGTVTNPNVDDGNPGDMSMVCDMSQTMSVEFSIKITMNGFTPSIKFDGSKFNMSMDGYQACTWTMQFNDAESSMLTGAIMQVMKLNSKDGKTTCPEDTLGMMGDMASNDMVDVYCVKMEMNADIQIVGGTGYFADMSGTGSFSDTRYIPMPIPNGEMGGGGQGGGGGSGGGTDLQTACEEAGGTYNAETQQCEGGGGQGGGGGGGGGGQAEGCVAAGGTWNAQTSTCEFGGDVAKAQCEAMGATWIAQTSTCMMPALQRASAIGRTLGRALSRADDDSGMTMKLDTKGGPKVVIASPLKIKGKLTLGAAPGGDGDLTLKAVAAPKSKCSITGSYGKKKNVVLSASKAYADGQIVTTITRGTLGTKLGVPKGKAADIVVSCSLGTGKKAKKFSAKAAITRG